MLKIDPDAVYKDFTFEEVVQRAVYMQGVGIPDELINLAVKNATEHPAPSPQKENKQMSMKYGG